MDANHDVAGNPAEQLVCMPIRSAGVFWNIISGAQAFHFFNICNIWLEKELELYNN